MILTMSILGNRILTCVFITHNFSAKALYESLAETPFVRSLVTWDWTQIDICYFCLEYSNYCLT